MSEWRTWSKEKHFFCFIPRSLDKKNINFHIYIYIYFNLYQLKRFFSFESTIVNPRPSACRNGERDCAAINATEICCNSVLPIWFRFFSQCFILVSQHGYQIFTAQVQLSAVSKHVILETVRTCGLIKINSFAAKAYSHCYLMNLQAGLGRIAIFFKGMFNDITVLAPSIDKYLIHLLDCNRHDYICLPQLIEQPNLLYRYVDIKTLDLAYGS